MKKRKTPDLEKYLEGKKRRFVNYWTYVNTYHLPVSVPLFSVGISP